MRGAKMKYWKSTDALLKLKDAVVTDIKTDSDYSPGYCDTCDIGEEYISIVNFTLEDQTQNFVVEYVSSLIEPINHSEFIRMILNNIDRFEQMTLEEFKIFFEDLQVSTDEESSEFYDAVNNI